MSYTKKPSGYDKRVPFSMVPNKLIQDPNISLKSKAVWVYLHSLPDNWEIFTNKIQEDLGVGKHTVRNAFKELREHGYLSMTKNYEGFVTYEIFWNPEVENQTMGEEPISRKPTSRKPTSRKSNPIIKKHSLQRNIYKKETLVDLKIDDIEDEKDKIYFKVSKMFFNQFRKNLIESGASVERFEKATWKSFVDPIRLMMEVDKISLEQFRIVFDFLKINDFWKRNILSTNKLRQQFNKLILQSKSTNGKPIETTDRGQGARNVTTDYLQQVIEDITGSGS